MKLNNVDVDRLKTTIEAVSEDPSKSKKPTVIDGEWNTGEGAQFSATVQYEGGSMKLVADQPSFLGGGGKEPGPMHFCLFGSASCYAATFATMAAMEGVRIERLTIKAESAMDFSKVFGLSDNPIASGVKFTISVDSDAPPERLKSIEELSKERCPAVYCLTNPIPLETELEIL